MRQLYELFEGLLTVNRREGGINKDINSRGPRDWYVWTIMFYLRSTWGAKIKPAGVSSSLDRGSPGLPLEFPLCLCHTRSLGDTV